MGIISKNMVKKFYFVMINFDCKFCVNIGEFIRSIEQFGDYLIKRKRLALLKSTSEEVYD